MAVIINNEAFNAVRNKIASVLGKPSSFTADLGYNLTPVSVAKNDDDKIYGNDLNLVIQDLDVVVTHQTANPSGVATVSHPNKITDEDLLAVSTAVDTAYTNRNTAGVSQLQVVNSDSYTNGSSWNSEHRYKILLDWGSNDQFRGWANLGGQIIIGGSMAGGSGSDQDAAWTNLFTAIGLIVFGSKAYLQTTNSRNVSFPNGGLYDILSPTGQQGANAGVACRILVSDAHYTANSFTVYMTPYGGTSTMNCTGFYIEYVLLDPHVKIGQGPDLIDSTLALSLNTLYAYEKKPTVTNSGAGLGNTVLS